MDTLNLQPHQERPNEQRQCRGHFDGSDRQQRKVDEGQVEQPTGVVDHFESGNYIIGNR